jgi:hypothetical protein
LPLGRALDLVTESSFYIPRILGCWCLRGTEIFYLSADGQMMAVPVKSQASIQVGKPKALFDVRGVSDFPPSYDVTRNGKGFLVNRNIGEGKPGYVLVIANWEALLKHSAVAR